MSVDDKPYTPPLPTDVRANRLLDLADWQRQRELCAAAPGKFHGDIAAAQIHWWHPVQQAWLMKDSLGQWGGWRLDGSAAAADADWRPWSQGLDDSAAPFYRWFVGGHTSAAFNEVDRHVAAGFGDEIAYWYEGDRWDPAANGGDGGPVHQLALSRRELFIQSVLAALALKALGLAKGDRLALNLPNILPQIVWTEAAKRLGVIYTAVFGGFSDKTLADRIENAGARLLITADGASRNAENIPFKEAYSDPALERYVGARAALALVNEVVAGFCDADAAAALVAAAEAGLRDEITLAPADVMRLVGRELAGLGLGAEQAVGLRAALAKALAAAPRCVEHVIVVRHAGLQDVAWTPGRDLWAEDLLEAAGRELERLCGRSVAALRELPDRELAAALWRACPCEPVEANFPLFIIYTSGSTGKPKGVVHCHGYVAGVAHTLETSFDAVPGRDRIYVVADPGWITGQSYLISASLAGRIPGVVAEGAPVFPHAGRFASIIQRHRITIFKAGVTFLKTVMANPQNRVDVERYDSSSLRVATFCAEPTSPSVQRFGMELMTPQYINSYWATEHGGIVWTHPYGNRDLRLRADTHAFPLPWVFGDVWVAEGEPDADGRLRYRRAADGERGEVVIEQPYPYLARTVWGDAARVLEPGWRGDSRRFEKTYFGRFKSAAGEPVRAYVQGDFAIRYGDRSFSFHGRSDDVMNVSGHRLGTEELEGAILKDKSLRADSPVGNCIVIGAPHRDRGQTPVVFLLAAGDRSLKPDDIGRLQALVREEKGAVAVPAAGDFIAVSAFPETRSGKYLRRLLKALILGEPLGDTSSLRNPDCVPELRARIDTWKARQSLAESQRLFEDGRFIRVRYDRLPAGLLASVLIQHPPVNSLSERVLDELAKTVEHLDRRDDVKAVVIASRRPGVFVAGADVRELLEDMDDLAGIQALGAKAHGAFARLESMRKPVIAALDGAALGGGCELALACHYRVGSRRARLGQPEINLFIPPGYGGTQRLPRLLQSRAATAEEGIAAALGLLLSGRGVDAEEALRLGLLDELTDGAEDVYGRVRALARQAILGGDGPAMEAMRERHRLRQQWTAPDSRPWSGILGSSYVRQCLGQAAAVGREAVAGAIVDLVRLGYAEGFEAGLRAEPQHFARFVMDAEHGGRKGIRLFLDKNSPALPPRPPRGPGLHELDALAAAGQYLPVGSPFVPGLTPIPLWQRGWGIGKDPSSGAAAHGEPLGAEREQVIAVPRPGPNDALIYVLASEMNFNDVWAITGIPISVFDLHDEDVHVTGSGALGMVVALGEAAQQEGRLAPGDVVSVYSGVSDLLSPAAADDPMFTAFYNQGYESPDGSHAQFMLAQAPQCIPLPAGLTLEQAGSYVLGAGTVYRCLAHSLEVRPGKRLLVEGAASGTGNWAVTLGLAYQLKVTGVVSSAGRAAAVEAMGARAVNRRGEGMAFGKVPAAASQWADWERAGEPWLEAIRAANDGELVDYAVSHAGETSFARSFQALAPGGVLSFYGASSGYHMTFLGKPGALAPAEMLVRAGMRPGEACVIHYGEDEAWDHAGLTAIEAVRAAGGRIVVITRSDAQRDLVMSLGFGDAVLGSVSLEALRRREAEFVWPDTLPELPNPVRQTAAFKEAVRRFAEYTFKPLGIEVGKLLRSSDNPKGVPTLVLERAHQDSLAVSTMLVAPFRGRVLYFEEMRGRRYSFYAPQVWNRQRRILMPGAAIHGTHLANAAEVLELRRLVEAGVVEVPPVHLFDWNQAPQAHQAIWDNRLPEITGGAAKALLNHALPGAGIKSADELQMRWWERDG